MAGEVEAVRVTATVYVIVVPSWAVTTVLIGLLPTARLIAPLAAPEVTAIPLTVTVAPAWAAVGVTVRVEVALGTLAV